MLRHEMGGMPSPLYEDRPAVRCTIGSNSSPQTTISHHLNLLENDARRRPADGRTVRRTKRGRPVVRCVVGWTANPRATSSRYLDLLNNGARRIPTD